MMDIHYKIIGDVFSVRSTESVDRQFVEATISKLKEHKADVKTAIIDMHQCSYLNSKSLAQIIMLKKSAGALGIDISLANVSEPVLAILEMTNLINIFKISEDYTAFNIDELCVRFLNAEKADKVSEYLATNYDSEIRRKLVSILEGDDGIMSEYAVLTMGRAYDFDSIETIRKQLDSNFYNVQSATIRVVGWLGDTQSKESLYNFIKEDDQDIASIAAASIALLSDDSDAEKLAVLLNSDKPKNRMSAMQALTLIADDKCYNILVDRLKIEKDDAVRRLLVSELAMFNKVESRDIFLKLLEDISISVKEAAAAGFAKVGAGIHTDVLLSKVDDKDTLVAYFAVKSLSKSDDPKVIEKLIALYDIVDDNVKLAIVEVVSYHADVAGDFFKLLLDDPNEDIRKDALLGIAKTSLDEALAFAKQVLVGDSSWLVRYNAVDIIITAKPEGYKELLKKHLIGEDNRYIHDKINAYIGE